MGSAITAHHAATKKSQILHDVYADVGVAELVGEEQIIRNTDGARCRAPIRRGRNKRHGIQPALVGDNTEVIRSAAIVGTNVEECRKAE